MSYAYESPVLGTIDGFKDPVTRESEGFATKESTKGTENHPITSEVPETKNIYLMIQRLEFLYLIIIFIVIDTGFIMLALPGFWYELLLFIVHL